MKMTPRFGLHYCLHGLWRYRIIFPIHLDGKLVAWTGRTIVKTEERRYRAEGQAPHYLLWFDQLKEGGDTIALCEGPMDALKLRTLGLPATCFFTSGLSAPQMQLLYDLLPRYRRCVVLLDRGTIKTTTETVRQLAAFDVEAIDLPPNRKDPGEIQDVAELRQILSHK
jgi:DNA primase